MALLSLEVKPIAIVKEGGPIRRLRLWHSGAIAVARTHVSTKNDDHVSILFMRLILPSASVPEWASFRSNLGQVGKVRM